MFNPIITSRAILNRLGIKYCFVGSYAASLHLGRAQKPFRPHRDVDILIPFSCDLKAIHDALNDEGWEPFRSDPIHLFSDPSYRAREFAQDHCAACYSTNPFTRSDGIDLLVNFPPCEVAEVIEGAIRVYDGIPLASVPALIANKRIAADDPKRQQRDQDLADAAALERMQDFIGPARHSGPGLWARFTDQVLRRVRND